MKKYHTIKEIAKRTSQQARNAAKRSCYRKNKPGIISRKDDTMKSHQMKGLNEAGFWKIDAKELETAFSEMTI